MCAGLKGTDLPCLKPQSFTVFRHIQEQNSPLQLIDSLQSEAERAVCLLKPQSNWEKSAGLIICIYPQRDTGCRLKPTPLQPALSDQQQVLWVQCVVKPCYILSIREPHPEHNTQKEEEKVGNVVEAADWTRDNPHWRSKRKDFKRKIFIQVMFQQSQCGTGFMSLNTVFIVYAAFGNVASLNLRHRWS